MYRVRPDFDWIDPSILGEDGHPVHERGVVTAAPGLYLVGQFFQYSMASSLIGGAGRDAAYVARHIASSDQRKAEEPDGERRVRRSARTGPA